MLTKVTKHSKNKLQAKKQTWVQFVFAVPWIIRNKTLPPIVGCLPLSYTFLSYCNCNGCWKYCKGYKFALSVARPRAKKLSALGGFAPWPGAPPLDPSGGSALRPRYGLALAMCPLNCPWLPLFQYSGDGAGLTVCEIFAVEWPKLRPKIEILGDPLRVSTSKGRKCPGAICTIMQNFTPIGVNRCRYICIPPPKKKIQSRFNIRQIA